MRDVSLTLVFQRSRAGQAIHWGQGSLPELHERLLMRMTGYTALADLLHGQEASEEILAAVSELLDRGYVDLVEIEQTFDRSKTDWAALLSDIQH